MSLVNNSVFQWNNNSLLNVGGGGGNGIIAQSVTAVDPALIVGEGKMTVTVPLEINGLDVEQILKDLMNATGVVSRNKKLEAKYKGLKEAGERYAKTLTEVGIDPRIKRAAEEYRFAEEKYKTFETIKDSR